MNTGHNKENREFQNVQRLEGDASSQIILPRALSDLALHDKTLLKKREALINSGKHKGNTSELRAYKEALPDLSPGQLDYCAGLILGDTSIQANNNGTAFRLKTQQAAHNVAHVHLVHLIHLRWKSASTLSTASTCGGRGSATKGLALRATEVDKVERWKSKTTSLITMGNGH